MDFLADLALDMCKYHVNNTGAWLVVNAHHLFQIDGILNIAKVLIMYMGEGHHRAALAA